MKHDWNLDKIKALVKTSVNLTEVLQGLDIPRQGNNSKTLRNILDKNNIDYSHFTGRAREYSKEEIPIEDYLSNRKSITSCKLKERLFKAGLKENKCENPECGITEWHNKPIICQLHHIDGNPSNNSLENLMILCPNCHSQTENNCGQDNKKEKIVNTCKDCGKPITKEATYCSVCHHKHLRHVDRPSKEELLSKYSELQNMRAMSRFYGVTDSSVKKWFKYYGLPYHKARLLKYLQLV